MRNLLLIFLLLITSNTYSQKFSINKIENFIKEEFSQYNLSFPPQNVVLRIFKHEKELEVWVGDDLFSPFELVKTYDICMISGDLGPKRKEGDLQVPEGFYVITELNSTSKYHLSLGINYPNFSDKILGNKKSLGGSIYIHGECVSIGCIAMSNNDIEEIYTICNLIKTKQIQVQIFPIRFDNKKSSNYLNKKLINKKNLINFEKNMNEGYNFFESKKRPPYIFIDFDGYYFFY